MDAPSLRATSIDPFAPPHRPTPARARGAALWAAAVAVAAAVGLRAADRTGAQAQDTPPAAALHVGAAAVPGRLGTHVWGGRAVDYRGIMTPRRPFTAAAGSVATLDIAGVSDAPAGLAAQWYDVSGLAPDAAEDDWAAWRPVGSPVPAAGVGAALRQPVRLPLGEGRWLLHVVGVWDGDGRGDVGWGWLVDVTPSDEGPERTYHGTYRAGFEVSSFISGTASCGGDDAWWLSADAATGFDERYRAAIAAQSGMPAGYTDYAPVETTIRARLSPPGRYGHLGAYRHAITVTAVLAVSPTLRCGMDKPDPALASPWYDFVCGAAGGFDRRLRFTLVNRGSQPMTRTVRIVARDAAGREVDRFDHVGALAPAAEATVERVWTRPQPAADPASLELDGVPRDDDRYVTNNRIAVPLVTMTPPWCPTASPTPTLDPNASATPSATAATPEPPARPIYLPALIR